MRKALVVTGVLGWLGGIGTLAAVGSCDTEDVQLETDRMDREDMLAADRFVGERPVMRDGMGDMDPGTCDMMARPSVIVYPARLYDDYFMPVDVEHLWFEHEGKVREAMCVPNRNGKGCLHWLAGFELDGEIKVSTEYCETVVDITVDVPMTADKCHVRSQFAILPVSTRGCLTTDEGSQPDPGPDQRAADEMHG